MIITWQCRLGSLRYNLKCRALFDLAARLRIIYIKGVMADPMESLGRFCEQLGRDAAESLTYPSWNGAE